jgi:hypothetical protein
MFFEELIILNLMFFVLLIAFLKQCLVGLLLPKQKSKRCKNFCTTALQRGRICIKTSQNRSSAEQIVDKLNLPITQRRVPQILATSLNFVFKKPYKKPALLQRYKDGQMEFATKYMHKKWKMWLFQTKKSLTLWS